MAILVVFDHDNTGPNAESDRRAYKRGDIVAVHDDSAHDGDLVRNPISAPWYIIKITGVTKAQVEHVLQPEINALDPEGVDILRRRLFGLTVADIPVGARNQLINNRYLEVTLAQARNYIRNKITSDPI
jgi:hypothetical protein